MLIIATREEGSDNLGLINIIFAAHPSLNDIKDNIRCVTIICRLFGFEFSDEFLILLFF